MPANGHQRKRKGDAGMAETEETTGVTEAEKAEAPDETTQDETTADAEKAKTETSTSNTEPGEDANEGDSWKTRSRKWEKLAKKNENTIAQLEKRLSEANKHIGVLEGEKIRTEVATAKGVPARFLQGATRKELEAFADDLKKSMTNATSDALANTTIGRSTPVQGVSDTREFLQKLNNKIRS